MAAVTLCTLPIKGNVSYFKSGHQVREEFALSMSDTRACGIILLRFLSFTLEFPLPTGGEVIIVIGGDVNYESDDEENRKVISRWAKRKVSSQFSKEYLDGTKSFIFSWNKQHRAIHEEALLHYFDPNKKGQKFHYQSLSPNQPSKPELPSQATSPELQNPQKPRSPTRNDEATSELTAVQEREIDSHRGGYIGSERSRGRKLTDPSFSNQREGQGDLDYSQRNFSEVKSVHAQNTQQLVRASQFSVESPPVVLLRGFARYGKVPDRYQMGDLQIWNPEFKVPADIQEELLHKHRKTPLIGLLIIKHSDGTIKYSPVPNLKEFSLDGEIQLAADEQLILKTRVCNGEVSFEDVAVQFKYGNVRIPQHIIDGFRAQNKKANGDLYIISNESEHFRCVVKSGIDFKKVIRIALEDVGLACLSHRCQVIG